MRIALFQPDIAGNCGTILRLGACLGVPVDIIEPCGFPFSDTRLKRAGMDYAEGAEVSGHQDWAAFRAARPERLVLLTTHGSISHIDAAFAQNDILLLGQEGAGVPQQVHHAAALRVRIPLQPGMRSLNVAVATAMVLGEALRQTGGYPA